MYIDKYKTFVFDLDGTLLDTLGDLASSVNHALRTAGMPERTTEEIRMFVGNGVARLIERAVPEGTGKPECDKVLQVFKKHYSEHGLDTTRPYPGIIEMLERLHAMNKNIAVVSNKFDAATKSLCKHFFGDCIDIAIGERESEGIRKKPAPDTVFEALRLMGVEKEDAVYVGDSDVDVATARNSGLECISVLWGFRDKDFLVCHGATTFVSSPEEILS